MNPHLFGAAASWVLGDKPTGFPAAWAQFAQFVSAVSPAAAGAFFDTMWQGAAVALGLFLMLRLAPRVSATHRFAAWTAGFTLVAALPLLPFAMHLFSGPDVAASASVAAPSRPWLELDSRWALAIAGVWIVGSALRLGDLVLHTIRLRRLWKTAMPVADGSVEAESLSGPCTHPSGAKAHTYFARLMARLKPCRCYKAPAGGGTEANGERSSGAKARTHFARLVARLKPCRCYKASWDGVFPQQLPGAKARNHLVADTARLKSCPDTWRPSGRVVVQSVKSCPDTWRPSGRVDVQSVKPCPDTSDSGRRDSETSIGRRVEICTTSELDRPSVIGFLAPRILIPEWLYTRLTPQELKQVVLHEVEHLCRHDDWTNLIQKLVLVLFPLSPALAWIERRLCREREMACDEGVVRRTQAPRAYAACLTSLAERGIERDKQRKLARELARRAEALSLAAWRRRPELVHRVHGILGRKPVLSPVAARVLLSVVGCGLLAGSVELARCPQAVAFVAAPKPDQIAQADAVNLDRAAYTPVAAPPLTSSPSGMRKVQTKAFLPTSGSQAMASAPARAHRVVATPAESTVNEIASSDAAGTPHETLLRAGTVSEASDQAVRRTYDAQQLVVFTAYERMQTLPQNGREFADYDTGAAADRDSGAGSSVAAAPRIVVTRMILRVGLATASSGQTSGSEHLSATKSASDTKPADSKPVNANSPQQPAVIPFGNGWLVFQL